MIKCPKCSFDNKDAALFCEQCREDLGGVVEAIMVEAVAVEGIAANEVAVAEAVIVAEPVAAAVVAEPVAEATATAPPAAPSAPAEPTPTADAAAAAGPAPEAAAAAPGASVPPGSNPKLIVIRGEKRNVEYPIYGDMNFLGRADEKSVDIDLEDQEPPDRVHSSRQHAVIQFDEQAGNLTIEDLNSSNGTYVNRNRIYPGQKKQLFPNDVIQIGSVHLKLQV